MLHLPFLAEMPYLYLLQGAFTIWMLVDCYRRGGDMMWFWIILFFPGFGAWIYFFVIKVRDFGDPSSLSFWPFNRGPSLEELHYRVQQSPTLANRLAMGERLVKQGEHTEAVPYLEAILPQEPEHCPTLYLLAECHMELNRPEQAIPLLQKLIVRDRRWSNYRAWYLLRQAQVRTGDQAGAVQTSQELVRLSPTLQHRVLLAEELLEKGDQDEAWKILEKGLDDHRYAPGPIRRRNRRWASQAKQLQKRIVQQEAGSKRE